MSSITRRAASHARDAASPSIIMNLRARSRQYRSAVTTCLSSSTRRRSTTRRFLFRGRSLTGSATQKLAEVLDFTVDAGGSYKKDESEKLTQRISNEAQTATSALVHAMPLKDTLRAAKAIEEKIFAGLKGSVAVNALGLEVLAVNVLAVRGTPEMGARSRSRNA